MTLYVVSEDTCGSWENEGVYSVWTDKAKALAERDRLNLICHANSHVFAMESDTPSDVTVTWEPEYITAEAQGE